MTTVTAVCLCGAITQKITLGSYLPGKDDMCHCNMCRYTTGAMAGTFVTLKQPPSSLDMMVKYEASKSIGRYFCGRCGTHCFAHNYGEDRWVVQSGIIEQPETYYKIRDVVVVTGHFFLDDTVDGGMAGWLTKTDGKCYAEEKGEGRRMFDVAPATWGPTAEPAGTDADRLHVSCHCGGVRFYIVRPSSTHAEPKRWVNEDRTKYRAVFCVCRSCRLGTGQPLQPWTYLEKGDLRTVDDGPLEIQKLGTLKQYNSSPGVYHNFCGTCGATVFYRNDERSTTLKTELVNVAVGLVRSKAGARAEDWLEWSMGKVLWREEALDNSLVDALLATT